jgi:uncharacterized membrane protein (UPF0127 family)
MLVTACAVDSGGEDQNGSSSNTPTNDTSSNGTPIFSGIPLVRITTSQGNTISVEVELARTPAEQQRGLMFRENLDPFAGMLFVFDFESQWEFTMENTLIPLDMIHLDQDQRVVGIVRNAIPNTLGPYVVEPPSRYVLEVNGGFASREGVSEGDIVRFSGFSPE